MIIEEVDNWWTYDQLARRNTIYQNTDLENYIISRIARKQYPYLKEKNVKKVDKETGNEIISVCWLTENPWNYWLSAHFVVKYMQGFW